MVTAVIIQARYRSTRLPGKVLMDLAGQTVLSHVLSRCLKISNADVVCCAIPDTKECDPIAEEAIGCGAVVFRGSETDVLSRYYQAARSLNADHVLRVTSDCPLIDPIVCEKVIDLLNKGNCDFATNNNPPSWPHGLDCEAFSAALLERANSEATDPYQREHVSPWMRDGNPNVRIKNFPSKDASLTKYRWTIDYQEDFNFLTTMFEHFTKNNELPSTQQVLDILKEYPEIISINEKHHTTKIA